MTDLNMLHRMDIQELNELMVQCKQMIDLKGGLGRAFQVGQSVTIDKSRFFGMTGKIEKVNQKKCKVFIDGTTWNVPHSMLIAA